MTPHTTDTPRQDNNHDDNLDARSRRISDKILDGVEETLQQLQELAQPRAPDAATLRAQILKEARRAVQAHCAVLLCRHALCRRTKSCRTQPCRVPASAFDGKRTMQPARGR